jgi:ferric-dicitrate binding protein FerR (iron transport regulator)
MDTIRQLISRYLDNELSEEQAEQLAASLRRDSSCLDEFVLDSVIHSQLLDLMDEKRLQDRVIGETVENECGEMLSQPSSMAVNGVRAPASYAIFNDGRSRFRSLLQRWSTLAAILLVAASISTVAYVVLSQPTYIGTLTEANGARWATDPGGVAVGKFLQSGQELQLVTGNAVITFSSGAKLYLEAPAVVRLDSPKDIQLMSGFVAAKVPRTATGFTVHSSLADFIDLGTAFTVNLTSEKSFKLHVFEGMVEVRVDERFGKAAQIPAWVAEVQAVEFNIKSADIQKLHFEEGKTMPF